MSVDIRMGKDGILRAEFSGDLDSSVVEQIRREFTPYIEASTPESPLKSIVTFYQLGKISFKTRRYMTELNQDSRYGAVAYIQPPRKARVLSQFIQKGSHRKNIQFFETEQEAINWIHQFEEQLVF
ncbi:MAG: STAS/SEC14 domain-containing protein [Anaerolineales bacterium]|jgi:hypothetical protein